MRKNISEVDKLTSAITDFNGNLAYEIDTPSVYGVCGRTGNGELYFDSELLQLKSIKFLRALYTTLCSLPKTIF